MRVRLAAVLPGLGLLLSGCEDHTRPETAQAGLRVVNAYTMPVAVSVDGEVVASSLPTGQLDSVPLAAGDHTVALTASGSATVSLQVGAAGGVVRTVAAVRLSGILAASALDDTNAVVPLGATKVRVLHLAPNAGEIEVFRTQPDYNTPISWQFPFLYDSVITPLRNPYFQSTVGTWDIRAWRKPSEVSLGWDGTAARVTLTLASGQKRTVLVLDKAGGGIQLSVIE